MELSNNDIVSGMRKLKDDQDFMFGKTGQIEQMMIDLRHKEVLPAIQEAEATVKKVDNLVKESKVNKQSISNINQAIDEAKASSNAAIARAQELLKDIKHINDKWDAHDKELLELMNNLNSLTTEQRQRASELMQKQQELLANINTVNDKWGNTAKQLADQITTLNGLTDGLDATKAELTKLSDQAKAQGKTVITLQQNADGLTQAVADVKGNVSKLQQSADEIKESLVSQDGRLTNIETKAGEMTTTLSKQQTMIDSQGKTITGQGQQINRIKLTADQATATLVDQGNSINKVQATANQLSADLQTANGDIDQLKITTNGLSNQVGRMVSDDELDRYKQAIKQYQDETKATINGKANQSAVDDLVKRMQAQGGQITTLSSSFDQTKEALKFKADKTTVDGIKSQVDTVSAQQTIQANEIAQRVTQAMLNNSLKDVATQDFVSSQVKQWADRFNINLTSLQTKFDKQQNTSMNLVTDTPSDWVIQSGDGYQTIQTQSWEVEPGAQYTFSIEYQNFNRGQDNSTWRVEVWTGAPGPNRISPWIQTWLTTDQKGTLTGTVTAPAGTERLEISLAFGWNTGTTQRGSSINWRRLMVVKGDKPAPWTPAPADLATTKQVTDLNVDLSGVKSTVATQGQAISEFNQRATGLEGRVADNKNNIDSLKLTADGLRNQVGTMVSKADLADATKKISDLSTLVNQTKSAVDIKANQTDVDRLKQSVNDANAKISVQANQITNLVTKSDLTTATNGLATQNWVQTQVSQQANQWNLNIIDLQTKLNDFSKTTSVNLITNTPSDWVKVSGNSYMAVYFHSFPVTPGETYTISVEFRNFNPGNGTLWGIQVWDGVENGNRQAPIIKSNYSKAQSGIVTVTTTAPTTSSYMQITLCFSNGGQTGASVEYRRLMAVKGTIAQPYMPAPADLATVKSVTDLTATVDGIKSTVQNTASKSEVTQLANALQQKVSSDQFESRISQLDNDWNVRVTDKTNGKNLMNEINVSAGRTLFNGGKVVINGDTIISGGTAWIEDAMIVSLGVDKLKVGKNTSMTVDGSGNLKIRSKVNGTHLDFSDDKIELGQTYQNTDAKSLTSALRFYRNDTRARIEVPSETNLGVDYNVIEVNRNAINIGYGNYNSNKNHTHIWVTKSLVDISDDWNKNSSTAVKLNVGGWGYFNGYVEAMGHSTHSTLSSKTNITSMDIKKAYDLVNATDLAWFTYKREVESGETYRHAGPIIDDVNQVSQYHTPKEFISPQKDSRDDGNIIGTLMGAVQYLSKKVEELEKNGQ